MPFFLGTSPIVTMSCVPAAEDDPVTGNLLPLTDDQEVGGTFIPAEVVDITDNSFLHLYLPVLHNFPIHTYLTVHFYRYVTIFQMILYKFFLLVWGFYKLVGIVPKPIFISCGIISFQ